MGVVLRPQFWVERGSDPLDLQKNFATATPVSRPSSRHALESWIFLGDLTSLFLLFPELLPSPQKPSNGLCLS